MVRTFGRWDCINARQREMAKEARFAAYTSPLTSPATHRPPPKCGAFRLQPRGSPLRQTGCWRETDSNLRFLRETVNPIAAHRESREVMAKQDLVLGRGQSFGHHFSPFEKRILSCSITF